jgi:hypothetical protein
VRPFAAVAAQTKRCILFVRIRQTNKQQTRSFEFYLLASTHTLCLIFKINILEVPIAGGRTFFVVKFPSEKLPNFG